MPDEKTKTGGEGEDDPLKRHETGISPADTPPVDDPLDRPHTGGNVPTVRPPNEDGLRRSKRNRERG